MKVQEFHQFGTIPICRSAEGLGTPTSGEITIVQHLLPFSQRPAERNAVGMAFDLDRLNGGEGAIATRLERGSPAHGVARQRVRKRVAHRPNLPPVVNGNTQ